MTSIKDPQASDELNRQRGYGEQAKQSDTKLEDQLTETAGTRDDAPDQTAGNSDLVFDPDSDKVPNLPKTNEADIGAKGPEPIKRPGPSTERLGDAYSADTGEDS